VTTQLQLMNIIIIIIIIIIINNNNMFYENLNMWLYIKLDGVILTETLCCQSFGTNIINCYCEQLYYFTCCIVLNEPERSRMGNKYLEPDDRRLGKCKNNAFDMKFSKLLNTV